MQCLVCAKHSPEVHPALLPIIPIMVYLMDEEIILQKYNSPHHQYIRFWLKGLGMMDTLGTHILVPSPHCESYVQYAAMLLSVMSPKFRILNEDSLYGTRQDGSQGSSTEWLRIRQYVCPEINIILIKSYKFCSACEWCNSPIHIFALGTH